MEETPNQRQKNELFTLITGASTGLGRAFAIECARRKMNLLLVALGNENLPLLCDELRKKYKVKVYFKEKDLTLPQAPFEISDWVKNNFNVNMLINNAGIGGSAAFDSAPVRYLDTIIQLNIRATTLLSRLLIAELKKHRKAHILNVSSVAAFSPFPFKTIYPASKTFILSFSRGLRAELRKTSIRVSVINPGPILTNPEIVERINCHGFLGKITSLTPEKAAKKGIRAMLKSKKVIIPGLATKLNYFVMWLVPTSIRLRLLSALFEKEIILKAKAEKSKDNCA